MVLPFDGSHLGKHKLELGRELRGGLPGRKKGGKILFGYFLHEDHKNLIYLKRATKMQIRHQVLVDEIKPLFGMEKMGTHVIMLDHKYNWDGVSEDEKGYPLLKREIHNTEYLLLKRENVFYPVLSKTDVLPIKLEEASESKKQFFFEVQKILLFKELFRISNVKLDDIVVKFDPNIPERKPVPLSINEVHIRDLDKDSQLSSQLTNRFFYLPYIRGEILVKMFALTPENCYGPLAKLRNEMWAVVNRCGPELDYIVEHVIDQIKSLVEDYFERL